MFEVIASSLKGCIGSVVSGNRGHVKMDIRLQVMTIEPSILRFPLCDLWLSNGTELDNN